MENEKQELKECPVCGRNNDVKYQRVMQVESVDRVACANCGCIYFAQDKYVKPVYDMDYNMHFFRGTDIRKAGIVACELDNLLENETDGKLILDVGTGNGLVPALMQCMNYTVHALDIDENLTNMLGNIFGIQTMAGRFEEYNFEQEYNLIYSGHCIEHVENVKGWMEKAKKILAPDGLIYIDTPNADQGLVHRERWKHFNTRDRFEHCCVLSPKSMEILALSCGLKVRNIFKNVTYGSFVAILEHFEEE